MMRWISWLLPACLMAAEIGGPSRVQIVRLPQGGEAAEAQITRDGVIHVLYHEGGIPYYVRSADHGVHFSAPLAVVNRQSRRPGLVFTVMGMAVGQGGAVHVAMITNNWQTKLPDVPEGLVYAVLAPGAGAFTPVRSLNGRPSEGSSLAADESGNVAATWLADKLFANFSHDGGRSFTANAEIDPSFDPCNCCTTRAVYGPGGTLAVLYREETNNDRDIYLVLLGKDGSRRRTRLSVTPWKVNACPMTYYGLSPSGDGYVAAWPTKGEIYFARLDRDGKLLPPGEIKTPGRSQMRSGVVALAAPDGTALVAWKNQGQLGWQIYDAGGRPGTSGALPSAGKGAAAVVDGRGRFLLIP